MTSDQCSSHLNLKIHRTERLRWLQAAQRYLQDAQASRACFGLLRQLANSDAIKDSIVAASGLELVNQAVSCHLASAGELVNQAVSCHLASAGELVNQAVSCHLASAGELVDQAMSCHLASAGELAGNSYVMLQSTTQTLSSHQPMLCMTWTRQKVTEGLARQWL